jgi:hypothetical protein
VLGIVGGVPFAEALVGVADFFVGAVAAETENDVRVIRKRAQCNGSRRRD